MADRQQKKEAEKSKTNLVKREAKIDATFTQKLIISPFSQGWNHLDALPRGAAVMEANSPTSRFCLLRAGFPYGSLPAMFSWFLHRQP